MNDNGMKPLEHLIGDPEAIAKEEVAAFLESLAPLPRAELARCKEFLDLLYAKGMNKGSEMTIEFAKKTQTKRKTSGNGKADKDKKSTS